MSTSKPQTLAEYIDRFIKDASLAHDFVKGDATTMVHGEDGDYPSLAMLAANAQNQLQLIVEQQLSGMVVRKYNFINTNALVVKHGLGTKLFEVTLINSEDDRLHAAVEVVDENEFHIIFTENEAGVLLVKFFTA